MRGRLSGTGPRRREGHPCRPGVSGSRPTCTAYRTTSGPDGRAGRARLAGVSANASPTGQTPTATPGGVKNDAVKDSAFLKACRREPVPHTPVWFMRQAGRSLPEYRKVREGIGMLDSCMRPELVTEITLQPVRRHRVDAAIYFSDIVVPLKAIGIDLDIKPGIGPVVEQPVRTRADLARLRDLTPEDVSYVTEAIGMLTRELGPTPLIGFAGAPFTLASYLVEGGPSRTYENAKAMMYGDPELWADLLDRLAEITSAFLKVQIEAGASAVQLFDSWAGALAPADYRRSVLPASAKVFDAVAGFGVPRIHFGVGTGELLGLMGEAGADVVGVDWRVPMDEAARRVGPGKALQGNLDPTVLFAGREAVETKAREVLDSAADLEGHIFNLGHGVMPNTDADALTRLVEYVHTQTAR
ncbi:Uroporphyrinogen decarboxylase OS=Streptomyces pilosus OX=28893 GN=hemE PE=3 SV=1 [Streptomyces pilosus]